MKNAKTLFPAILFTLSVIIILSSCSKEKRLDRRLTKKDGVWSVSSVTYTQVRQDTSGQNITVESAETNTGTWTFDDGLINYDYTLNGEKRTGTFSYSINEKEISIVAYKMSFSGIFSGNISQSIIAYTGKETDKGSKLEITGSETYQGISGSSFTQEVLTATFTLTR